MSKDKKLIKKDEEKIYFYEISATIVILFCLITFSELGFVGKGLKSALKILFGDFYFVFLFYLLFTSIKALLKKKWFDFTSIRFNGFLLFFTCLIALNHLGFYERLDFAEEEIFTKSLSTYLNTFRNLIHIDSYGGGLLGGLILQIFIFLFNPIGTTIILIVLLILAFTFMTNISYKTVLYYSTFFYKKVRSSFIIMYKYFNNIKFPTKKIKKAKLNFNLNLNILNDIDNQANEAIAIKLADDEKNQLIMYFKNLGYEIKNILHEVGYNAVRNTIYEPNIKYDKVNLKQIISPSLIIKNKKEHIIIETPSKVKRLLTLKSLLMSTKEIPLGLELNNNILVFKGLIHQNILLTGSKNVGIKTFIKTFIVSNIFKYRYDFKIVFFDFNQNFIELKYLPNLFLPFSSSESDFINHLDLLAKELERRIDLLSKSNCKDYEEYQKKYTLNNIYVFINDLSKINTYLKEKEVKLVYFLKFGFKVGIHFIMLNRDEPIEKQILSNTLTKIVFKSINPNNSYDILNNDSACLLENKRDAIVSIYNETYRIASCYISKSDYDKVITKFICN